MRRGRETFSISYNDLRTLNYSRRPKPPTTSQQSGGGHGGPISYARLLEDLYYLDLHEQSAIRSIDASVGDVKQELLDIQSALNYYRTKLDGHARETKRAWDLIQRHKTGIDLSGMVSHRPPPFRVFKKRGGLQRASSSSCTDLSCCTGSGIDRRWSISTNRLNLVGRDDLSMTTEQRL